MGILRTDKISGLETPTAITSSVYFDGDARNDNLNMSADYHDLDFQNTDFTFESWVYPTDMSVDRYWCSKGDGNLPGTAMDVRFDSDGQINITFYVSSTAHSLSTDPGDLQENVWSHVAVVRSGTSFKSYVNGKETSSATHDITISDVSATFKIGILEGVGTGFKGYMSDFRFVRGKAVYTEEFTPPVYALEPIDGTVLLCCNNPDSAAAVSIAGIGTSKNITVNGDVSIASTNPGSLKDFTYGTEFRGVTSFDTQGYFVPPSGTTEQRGRDRGLIGGGTSPNINSINYIRISSQGNAKDFGDLTSARFGGTACASSTRGVFIGGATPGLIQDMEFVTIASEGNAIDFGGDTQAVRDTTAGGNNVRGFKYGGIVPGSSRTQQIDTFNIASTGQDATDFGDLTTATSVGAACGSSTRGLHGGGAAPGATNLIEFITYASTGTPTDFGELTRQAGALNSCSSPVRGVWANGGTNTIDYVTISTLGNAQDFGDTTLLRTQSSASCSNSIRGVFCGGYQPSPDSTDTNVMDFIVFATTGNAKDFGDLPRAGNDSNRENAGCSDSHGGIS